MLISIFISNITDTEVTETILDLNNSSPGYDEVPAIVLEQNIHMLIKPLTYLINSSINKGIFPDELKIAKVISIFRSGEKTSIENYRPISVLSVFSQPSRRDAPAVMRSPYLHFLITLVYRKLT